MNVAVLFRSPLLSLTPHGPAVQYQILNPQIQGAIAAVDGKELWRLNIRGVKPEQLDSLNAPEKLRYALGENIPFELLAVRPWTGHCVVAEHYQNKRVFLAGDAAHLNWPAGGFGMNTGIGDAVDIGWKLAAVLQGWGGTTLARQLRSGTKTRRHDQCQRSKRDARRFRQPGPFSPIFEENSEARTNSSARKRVKPYLRTRAKEFQNDSPGIEFGYRYSQSPICIPDGPGTPAGRSRELYADHMARSPRAACLAKRRPLDSRSIRQRLHAAGSFREEHGYVQVHFRCK